MSQPTPGPDGEPSSLTVAGAVVPPGERRDLAPLVSESYTGDRTTLPLAVVNGAADGPVVFVTAAIHGDELNGIAICRQLLPDLDPATLRGAVLVVPIANVLGAQTRSRYLPDRRDLNRSFPGTSKGSMASRIARIIHEEVVRGASAGIDLHTAANRRANVPQLRIDTSDPRALELARAFGAPYVLDASLRPGSLRESARQRGVPVLTYEAGEPLRFDDDAIRIGLDGILRVLHDLDMIDDAPPPPGDPPLVMHESTWLRADRGGILELHVGWGDHVEEGQPVWTTTSPLGAERATMESPVDGVVIGGTTIPLVAPGDAVMHVGVLGDRPAWEDDPSDEEDDADDTEA
jgi:predicted deacylase